MQHPVKRDKVDYLDKLKKRYGYLPEVKKISKFRNVPKSVYRARQTKSQMRQGELAVLSEGQLYVCGIGVVAVVILDHTVLHLSAANLKLRKMRAHRNTGDREPIVKEKKAVVLDME